MPIINIQVVISTVSNKTKQKMRERERERKPENHVNYN